MDLIDSGTGTKFSLQKGKVYTWYNCGPTIYNRSHMGHAELGWKLEDAKESTKYYKL